MRIMVLLLFCAVLLGACANQTAGPASGLEPPSVPTDPVLDPPVHQNPPSAPVLPGGPGQTPDPIKVEVPIGPIGTPITLDPQESIDPSPEDEKKVRSSAYIDSAELLILESHPVQVNLQLAGGLPTPCHKLRIAVSPPDAANRISIEVYSVVDSDKICIQVIDPFTTTVKLGSYSAGHYSVYVNDELVGEFDS